MPCGAEMRSRPVRPARMLLQFGLGELHHLHHRLAALEQQRAGIGQADRAGGAVEQAHAEAGSRARPRTC